MDKLTLTIQEQIVLEQLLHFLLNYEQNTNVIFFSTRRQYYVEIHDKIKQALEGKICEQDRNSGQATS